MQKKKTLTLTLHLTPYISINSKWLIGTKGSAKTGNFPEENIGENLCNHGLGKVFLDMTQKERSIKIKSDKLTSPKVKILTLWKILLRKFKKPSKQTKTTTKDKLQTGRKYFENTCLYSHPKKFAQKSSLLSLSYSIDWL